VPLGVVEAGEGDGFGFRGQFAGGFEAPVAVEKNGGGGRIIAISVCGESGTENENGGKEKHGATLGHRQASRPER